MRTTIAILALFFLCALVVYVASTPTQPTYAQGPTATPTLRYHVFQSDPGVCNNYILTPQAPCQTYSEYSLVTSGSTTEELFVCVYDTTDTLGHFIESSASGLSPGTDVFLYKDGVEEWKYSDVGDCEAISVSDTGYDMLSPGSVPAKYRYRAFAAGGSGQYCNPQASNYAEVSIVLSDTICFPTPTPTPTNTPSPVPTLPGATVTPLPTLPDMGNAECVDIGWVYPISVVLNSVNDQIASINADVVDTDQVDVDISSNPFALARGFIVLSSRVSWLGLLWLFFSVALILILILFAIRFVAAFWGIVDRIIALWKAIPFVCLTLVLLYTPVAHAQTLTVTPTPAVTPVPTAETISTSLPIDTYLPSFTPLTLTRQFTLDVDLSQLWTGSAAPIAATFVSIGLPKIVTYYFSFRVGMMAVLFVIDFVLRTIAHGAPLDIAVKGQATYYNRKITGRYER